MENEISIRKMQIEDYDQVYALWMSCKGMGLNNLDDSRDGIYRFLNRNPETCFVAIDQDNSKGGEGVIVGVILVGNDGRRGYIHHTAVNPEHRKQGIAKELVNNAMDALKAIGIHKVTLVAFERNKIGNQFWEKMGFTKREDLVYRNKTLTEMVRIDT